MAVAVMPWGGKDFNLPENSDSDRQQQILDALPVLILLERAGKIVYANAEARAMLDEADVEWMGRPVEDVLWGLFPGSADPYPLYVAGRRSSLFHVTIPARNGRLLALEGTYSMLDPARREAVIVAHPGASERAPRPRLMEDVLSSIPEAVAIVHSDRILYTNAAFTRLFGYGPDEAAGGRLRELIVPETRQHEEAQVHKTVDLHGSASIDTVRMHSNGDLVDVSLLVCPLMVGGGKAGYVYSFRDIGERKLVEARLQHDALRDTLTGLPNRALFVDRLSLALTRQSRRGDQTCGVLYLDIDSFRQINDSFGHAAGDALLLAFTERLRSALRPQDTAARLGGDEFAVLVEGIASSDDLEIVARRIVEEAARPFQIFGHTVETSISLGAVLATPEHHTPDDLLRDADLVLYRAKQRGGSGYEFFDRNLDFRLSNSDQREQELRRVLEAREYEIWYQPFFRLDSGQLAGFESLLRWRRADGTYDSFRDLLAVAEDTGLSLGLGRQTLEAVLACQREWSLALPGNKLLLTINVTRRQFYNPDFTAILGRALQTAGADPTRLLFEVAETTLNEHPDEAVAILQRMVDLGVRVGIDNFGAGLAPFTHFLRMPLDFLKLDPRVSAASTLGGRQLIVLESILRLGRDLGIEIVAQGIESPDQLEALAQLGCTYGQGYLLSEAVDQSRANRLAAAGLWLPPDEP